MVRREMATAMAKAPGEDGYRIYTTITRKRPRNRRCVITCWTTRHGYRGPANVLAESGRNGVTAKNWPIQS